MWRDYIEYLERKYNDIIIDVDFRDKKRFGWKAHKETVVLKNGGGGHFCQLFTMVFYQHIALRPSCSKCHFCNTTRPSDITLADFWDRGHHFPEVNKDNKGESLLLINTEKGREIFDAVKDRLDYFQTTTDKVMQTHLREPSKVHPQAKQFEEYYAKYGFEPTMRHFGFMGWRYNIKRLKKRIVSIIQKCRKHA